MNHSRTYSYDDQSYSPVEVSQQSPYTYQSSYPRYDQQSSHGYYVPGQTSNGGHVDPRLRSTTPMAPHNHTRYSRGVGEPRYSSGLSSTHSGYYNSSPYPGSHSSDRFIPTPSDLASTYYSNQQLNSSQSPSTYTTPGHHSSSSRHTRNSSSSPTSGRPNHSSRTPSSVSPSTERYPCDMCGKTFSRSHDRKRHHETQHIPCPVLHRCRYCRKEFSRADSLKRHLDNGCDEAPTRN